MSISIEPSIYNLSREIYPWLENNKLWAAFENPLIIGNPNSPYSQKWLFPPMAEAENEVKKVADIMNSQALIGKEARKQAVISKAENW
jgi:CHAT domain-containing protein